MPEGDNDSRYKDQKLILRIQLANYFKFTQNENKTFCQQNYFFLKQTPQWFLTDTILYKNFSLYDP